MIAVTVLLHALSFAVMSKNLRDTLEKATSADAT